MIGLLFYLVTSSHFYYSASGAALPDPALTPGAVRTTDEAVVCVKGYAKNMRKLVHTATLKAATAQYGVPWKPKLQEADHLISLELGGEPDTITNLWPQPYPEAKRKDLVENYLHKQVCAGLLPLIEAQRQIATDWTLVVIE